MCTRMIMVARELQLESRDGVDLKFVDTHGFTASVPGLGIAVSFNAGPAISTTKIRRISAFDISPDASLVAAGHLDEDVSIQSATAVASVPLKTTKLHLSTV